MNLDTDFLRSAVVGNVTYYGYALNPSTKDGDKNWSIRTVDTTGPTVVKWNNNSRISHTAIWDNRVDHFTAPGTASVNITSIVKPQTQTEQVLIGLTWSSVLLPNKVNMGMTWSEVSGVDVYKLTIKDQNGVIYTDAGGVNINPWHQTAKYTSETFDPNYNFVGKSGMTYSITIESINQAGKSSTSLDYLT